MEDSTEMKNQIYISTLKTAIQKALTKNLPLILNDVVEYLEKHDFEVKQRKRRTKTKSLQKKTQACLNLNTKPLQISEFSDDGKEKIKKKFVKIQSTVERKVIGLRKKWVLNITQKTSPIYMVMK